MAPGDIISGSSSLSVSFKSYVSMSCFEIKYEAIESQAVSGRINISIVYIALQIIKLY